MHRCGWRWQGILIIVLLVVGGLPGLVAAQVDFRYSGSFESDLRMVIDHDRGDVEDEPLHFNWNRNAIDYNLQVFVGENVKAVGHVRFLYFGIHKIGNMDDLVLRENIDPFRLDSESAYVEIQGFFSENLDVKVGRMIHAWGTADQFNPTDNLNGKDFEDPLRFGGKLGNQMAIAKYHLPWLDMSLEAVWIPMFRPTQLPASSALGMESADQMPVRDRSIREELAAEFEREEAEGASEFMEPTLRVNMPPTDLDNMSGGLRAQFRVGDFDMSLSYFYGRHGFPTPVRIWAYSGQDVQTDDGLKTEQHTFVDLIYPRFQAIGFDMAASLPWLADIGFWFEAALMHPEKVEMMLYTNNYQEGDPCAQPGDPGGEITLVCSQNTDPWYVKATLGFDYTFTSWLYMNLQLLHGFDDEFGYDTAMKDYVVAGADLKFFNDELLVRLFTLFNIQDQSAILFPQIILTSFDSVEMQIGSMYFLGGFDTKFGMRASGRNQIFAKVKASF